MKPGDRVELHPAHDLWMMGDRFGEIVRAGRRRPCLDRFNPGEEVMVATWWVRLDKSGRTVRLLESNLFLAD